jgi:hypothetical protein
MNSDTTVAGWPREAEGIYELSTWLYLPNFAMSTASVIRKMEVLIKMATAEVCISCDSVVYRVCVTKPLLL